MALIETCGLLRVCGLVTGQWLRYWPGIFFNAMVVLLFCCFIEACDFVTCQWLCYWPVILLLACCFVTALWFCYWPVTYYCRRLFLNIITWNQNNCMWRYPSLDSKATQVFTLPIYIDCNIQANLISVFAIYKLIACGFPERTKIVLVVLQRTLNIQQIFEQKSMTWVSLKSDWILFAVFSLTS